MTLLSEDKHGLGEKIDFLVVNIGQSKLLIPIPAVAEIIAKQQSKASDKLPAWAVGWIDWHHLTIPLIDFNAVRWSHAAGNLGVGTGMLVLKSFTEGHSHRYYAIMVSNFPHTMRIEADTGIASCGAENVGKCIKIDLMVQGETLLLPDFQEIESYLKQIPLYF
ncbi:MAG: chemotaxis protein CheW [Porticoccaceae bacterium]